MAEFETFGDVVIKSTPNPWGIRVGGNGWDPGMETFIIFQGYAFIAKVTSLFTIF